METKSSNKNPVSNGYAMEVPNLSGTDHLLKLFSKDDIINALEKINEFKKLFQMSSPINFEDQLGAVRTYAGKKSFLVSKNNKYVIVPTENIAFFYIKYESPVIVCFDKQEHFVNYSLDQIQSLLTEMEFFRLNRQYLVNFKAVKEVEHYFARKLLVNLTVTAKDKLIVSKEKVSSFLHWLDNR